MINDQHFPKQKRLLKPAEYQHVYKNGKWVSNRELSANFKEQRLTFCRLGITVSRKVSKRAVDRNRIKRQIREWFRSKDLKNHSIDIILTAKPSLNNKANHQIQESINDIWRKVQRKLS